MGGDDGSDLGLMGLEGKEQSQLYSIVLQERNVRDFWKFIISD